MISFKQYCNEKFGLKKIIKDILFELDHEDYYLDTCTKYNNQDAIYIKWYNEKAPIRIFEFKDIFENRWNDKYILEYTKADIDDIHYYIVKRD